MSTFKLTATNSWTLATQEAKLTIRSQRPITRTPPSSWWVITKACLELPCMIKACCRPINGLRNSHCRGKSFSKRLSSSNLSSNITKLRSAKITLQWLCAHSRQQIYWRQSNSPISISNLRTVKPRIIALQVNKSQSRTRSWKKCNATCRRRNSNATWCGMDFGLRIWVWCDEATYSSIPSSYHNPRGQEKRMKKEKVSSWNRLRLKDIQLNCLQTLSTERNCECKSSFGRRSLASRENFQSTLKHLLKM